MLVRTDLPVEQQIVQACHAAYECGRRRLTPSPTSDPDYSVICAVRDERGLLEAHQDLLSQGIPAVLFRENDLGDQATALAAAPVRGRQRRAFSNFSLWTAAPRKETERSAAFPARLAAGAPSR